MLKIQFIDECIYESETHTNSKVSELVLKAIKENHLPQTIKEKALQFIISTDFPTKGFRYKLSTERIEPIQLTWEQDSVITDNYLFQLRFDYVSPIYDCFDIIDGHTYKLLDPINGNNFSYNKKLPKSQD